jgi:hypothetical protein
VVSDKKIYAGNRHPEESAVGKYNKLERKEGAARSDELTVSSSRSFLDPSNQRFCASWIEEPGDTQQSLGTCAQHKNKQVVAQ